MKRKPKPISYAPQHRPVWRRFRRWCTCGLRWPCPDRFTGHASAPLPLAIDPQWNVTAIARPVGQQWRANGGRW
jgi:hypothetical protein